MPKPQMPSWWFKFTEKIGELDCFEYFFVLNDVHHKVSQIIVRKIVLQDLKLQQVLNRLNAGVMKN